MSPSLKNYLSISIILLSCVFVYWPGLSGPFLFDDYPNIIDNERLSSIEDLRISSIRTAISQEEPGPLGRPVSFVTFAINIAVTDLDPYWFKITNLLLHIICGIALLYLLNVLIRVQAKDPRVKLVAAVGLATTAAWLVHPFNLSSVLYVVQRMAQLSALFSILSMLLYSLARQRQVEGRSGATFLFIGLAITTLLGIFSKENGILIPGYLFLIETIFFRFRAANSRISRALITIHIGGATLALLLTTLAFFYYGASYQNRDFTLYERLLTQSRVLWFYIQSILLPDIRTMAMFHDDLAVSHSLWDPPTAIFGILGLTIAFTGAVLIRRQAPILSFGVLFYLMSHALESTFLPLEMIHEHRNYIGSWGLLWPVFFYLFTIAERYHRKVLAVLVSFLMIAILGSGTRIRAEYWSNELLLAEYHVHHHPNSFRSLISAGSAYSGYGEATGDVDLLRKSIEYYRRAHALNPHASNALVAIISLSVMLGELDTIDELKLRMLDNLENQPIRDETMNAFVMVSRCLAKEGCAFPPPIYREMAEAMLRNPRLGDMPRNAAKVYSANSNFAYLDGDLETAITYGNRALSLHPTDIQHWLNQSILLSAAGRNKDASAHLEQARKLDGTRYAAARIDAVERQLMLNSSAL